jgi:hypothetical protein
MGARRCDYDSGLHRHFKPGDTVEGIAKAISVAIIVYWIASEVSRVVFPPRNLFPAP